jgi:hypothetical protein
MCATKRRVEGGREVAVKAGLVAYMKLRGSLLLSREGLGGLLKRDIRMSM